MTRFRIFILLSVITTAVYSQTSTGNMMIGGGILFSSSSHQSGSANDAASFTFFPSFGYFISDGLAVGADLSVSSSRNGTGAGKSVSSGFGFGPFVRYYKFTSNENFAFFGNASLTFSTSKFDPPWEDVTRGNGIGFNVSPGAAFFFNEHWAMEMSFSLFNISSFDPDTADDDDKQTTVTFGLNSFLPSLGIRYHF